MLPSPAFASSLFPELPAQGSETERLGRGSRSGRTAFTPLLRPSRSDLSFSFPSHLPRSPRGPGLRLSPLTPIRTCLLLVRPSLSTCIPDSQPLRPLLRLRLGAPRPHPAPVRAPASHPPPPAPRAVGGPGRGRDPGRLPGFGLWEAPSLRSPPPSPRPVFSAPSFFPPPGASPGPRRRLLRSRLPLPRPPPPPREGETPRGGVWGSARGARPWPGRSPDSRGGGLGGGQGCGERRGSGRSGRAWGLEARRAGKPGRRAEVRAGPAAGLGAGRAGEGRAGARGAAAGERGAPGSESRGGRGRGGG